MITCVRHSWRSIYFKFFILKVYFSKKSYLIRVKLCFQRFIANDVSEIHRIRGEEYGVITWYLKGCSSKTIGFQGMGFLQILISTKFRFQRYRKRPFLQVKNFTCINCWCHHSRDQKLWLPQNFGSKFWRKQLYYVIRF